MSQSFFPRASASACSRSVRLMMRDDVNFMPGLLQSQAQGDVWLNVATGAKRVDLDVQLVISHEQLKNINFMANIK